MGVVDASFPTEESQVSALYFTGSSHQILGFSFPITATYSVVLTQSVFSHHFTCSSSRSSESAPTQFTNQLKESKKHYQKQCKRCHESLLRQLPRPTILLLIYLLEAAEVEVQNTSIDQAESAGKRLGTIISEAQAAGTPHTIQ